MRLDEERQGRKVVKYQENMHIPFPNTFAESKAQLEAIYRERNQETPNPSVCVCVSPDTNAQVLA